MQRRRRVGERGGSGPQRERARRARLRVAVSCRLRDHVDGLAHGVEVEQPLRVVLRDAHAAVRGGVGRYVGVLVHRDAAGERRRPTAAIRGTASTTSAGTCRRRGTTRSSSASRACRSRRGSRARPGCPRSRARAGGRSAPRPGVRRAPALIRSGARRSRATARVRSSAWPVRGRPCHFWNAMTAAVVPGPALPSTPDCSEVAEIGQLLLERARARRRRAAGRRDGRRRRGRSAGRARPAQRHGRVDAREQPERRPAVDQQPHRGHAGHGGHGAHDLVEPRERRVDGGALQEADAEVDRRHGAVQRSRCAPACRRARSCGTTSSARPRSVPRRAPCSASCTVAPGRCTATSCSPWPKKTLTVGRRAGGIRARAGSSRGRAPRSAREHRRAARPGPRGRRSSLLKTVASRRGREPVRAGRM